MSFIELASNPWGQRVPIHLAWILIWVALITGLAFLLAHAAYVGLFAKATKFAPLVGSGEAAGLPTHIPRHSLVARLFHWIMAAAMFTLLFTGLLPALGVKFAWVATHWVVGAVLTAAIVFHIVHASFWQDFWAIWPDHIDREDARRRLQRFFGMHVPPPRRFAKYPLDNKLYHTVVTLVGLTVIGTGVLMLSRVRTIFFPRDPYLFGDMAWGILYVLHGLAGVGMIALTIGHVYFALRPEKLAITKAMVFGWMHRDFYLEEHDPARWPVETSAKGEGAK